MKDDNKIAVMFSGGTDSTYAAWTQIPEYETRSAILHLKV